MIIEPLATRTLHPASYRLGSVIREHTVAFMYTRKRTVVFQCGAYSALYSILLLRGQRSRTRTRQSGFLLSHRSIVSEGRA